MTSTEIGLAVAGVLLVCWMVGAYNRMVSLRNVLAERFAAIDALHAASRQADAARAYAQARPAMASAVTSLRVAEEILSDARSRLPVQTMGGDELSAINDRLASDDAALTFARREFNVAVDRYNAAVRQFPTVLVARLFGFRAGATL